MLEKINLIWFMCMCVFVWVQVLEETRGIRLPEAGITGYYELLNMVAGNQTQNFK